MIDQLIRKLEQRDQLSAEEKSALEGVVFRVRTVQADEDIVREGDRPKESTLILEGWAARYKVLAEGKRQITALHIPGDFVDLHSFLLKTMDHGVLALTPCRLAMVPHVNLQTITEMHPHLTRLLWLDTLVDGAMHREWITAMGRRSTTQHMAHLFCELFLRLRAVGHTDGSSFSLPITQTELGDTLGVSTVHTNRVLQQLRGEGLVTWKGETVTIEDFERLKRVAEFQPTYLSIQKEHR